MCRVVYATKLFFFESKRYQNEYKTKEKGRQHDWYKHDTHKVHRIDEYIGKNNG